eukprot:Em0009g1164a
MFDIPQTRCADVGAASCRIYFSVCKQLPPEICGTGVSLCEKDWTSNGGFSAYNASAYTYEPSGSSVLFKWTGGNFSNCSLVTTSIAFQCSPKTRWDPTQPNVTAYLTSLNEGHAHACDVTISMAYAGACLTTPTSAMHTSSHYNKVISYRKLALVVVISILCILLGVVIFYLLVGIIFQVAVKKERGIKIIPNYDFWCGFYSSVLCCGICRGEKQGGAKYGHVGEEPDENL